MMKMKSVIAASAAVLTICAANAAAFAESADTNLVSAKDTEENNTTADNTSAGEASDKDNADTGVESVAAVFGAVALAGAAVVISRKRA